MELYESILRNKTLQSFFIEESLLNRFIPFGLKAAPQLFSSIIQDCFQWLSLYGCAWFMDDVIQGSGKASDTFEQAIDLHCIDMRRFFGRSRGRGFKYSIEKTAIAKSYICYLGHMLGQGKLFTTEKTRKNMEKVLETARIDMNDKSYERFYGFFQYSSKFLANFSKYRKEINEYRTKIADLKLDKTDSGLATLKDYIGEKQRRLHVIVSEWKDEILHRTLKIPEKDKPLTLITDASISALGYILYDSDGRIVELGGRMVNDTESRYTVYELELLAIAEAIDHYKLYIARANRLHILSDSKIARDVISSAKSSPTDRCLRFSTRIQQCPVDFDIKYIPTDKNPADFWSRDIPFEYENLEKTPVKVSVPSENEKKESETSVPTNKSSEEVSTEKKAEELSEQNAYVSTCFLSSEGKLILEKHQIDVVEISDQSNSLDLWAGAVLTRSMAKKLAKRENRLPSPTEVIPLFDNESDQESIEKISKWHEHHHHLGASRLWTLLKLVCKKPPARRLVEEAVHKCKRCTELRRVTPMTVRGKIPIPDQPGMSISIDHFSPFGHRADDRGFSTCLSIKDRFSKMVLCIPCFTHAHSEVVYHLQIYIQSNGVPRELKMDNFFKESGEMTKFTERFGINPIFSPAYHPASNGDVEITHKQLRKIIPLIIEHSKIPISEWGDACHIAANFINSTPHTVHGLVPLVVHRGYLSHEMFDHKRNIPRHTAKQWREVKEKLVAQSERNVHRSAQWKKLPPGTKVFLLLGDNKSCRIKRVPATVLDDKGLTILAEKEEKSVSGRFDIIPIHKSQVTLRF